jgi:hypothetical protein
MPIIKSNTTTPFVRAVKSYNFVYENLSNPVRTEVKDQNSNWLATFTNGSRTVQIVGPKRTFTEFAKPINDNFSRTRATSWGNATEGGRWTKTGTNSTSSFSVDGWGNMICETVNQSRRYTLINPIKNIDISYKFKTDKLSLGSSQTTGLLFAYQLTDGLNNHYFARCVFTPNSVHDTFNRTSIDSWGETNGGFVWSNVNGVIADFQVSSNTATHRLSSLNVSRRSNLNGVSTANFDITVSIQKSTLSTGASVSARIAARYVDTNNHYLFRCRFSTLSTNNRIFVLIQKSIGGTLTDIGTEIDTGITHDTTKKYILRAFGSGDNLKIKLWEEGAGEPISWQSEVTDSSLTTGAVGLTSIANSGNSETDPTVSYSNFLAQTDNPGDRVRIGLQKRISGTYSDIVSLTDIAGLSRTSVSDVFLMRVRHKEIDNSIKVKIWKQGTTEPNSWNIDIVDNTFIGGRVGFRCQLFDGVTNTPVKFSYGDLISTEQEWIQNPKVEHNVWVRLLDIPFNGTVDTNWLTSQLQNTQDDILATSMYFIGNSLPVIEANSTKITQRDNPPILSLASGYPTINPTTREIKGDCSYGSTDILGARPIGADFNDYLWLTATYPNVVDQPELSDFRSLDCSGYIRMIYGYFYGWSMSRSETPDGIKIPRLADEQTRFGPGVIIMDRFALNTPPTIISYILPGDILGFAEDTGQRYVIDEETGELVLVEEEGQEDIELRVSHIAIFLGIDIDGKYRFLSARQSANGPTMSDLSGNSTVIDGNNLYSRMFRIIRRF